MSIAKKVLWCKWADVADSASLYANNDLIIFFKRDDFYAYILYAKLCDSLFLYALD